jgi:SAM-dependent methyltransferase
MRRHHVATAAVLLVVAAWLAGRFPRLRPFAVLLSGTARLPPQTRSRVQKSLRKALYDTLNRLVLRGADIGFLNYGFASIDEQVEQFELPPASEPDRYAIQLYDRVAGAVALSGLDVLEVGCGRGGGAAFVFERHEPASMTGLDLAESAITHCRLRYARPGLRFVAGDAESLPFPDSSFDAVVNVESSHCYPNAASFFAEVERVLRPGGVLLFADFRLNRAGGPDEPTVTDVARLPDEMGAAGLVVVEEEDITANVVRALELDSSRRRALVEQTVPKAIRPQLLDFAGVEGSGIYNALAGRDLSYVRMVLRRAQDAEPSAA